MAEREDREDLVAVDDVARRGRRPGSGRRRRRARSRRRRRARAPPSRSGSRWVEPQPSLMLSPSGSAWIAITVAPASRSARGPASYAAPSAQSRTTREPVERLVERARRGGRRTRRPRVGYADHAADVAAGRAVPGPRRGGASIAASIGVVELEAAAGEELDAVVGHRVVRGGEHHAEVGAERAGEVGDARASGSTPSSSTSTPAEARPATTAASRNCPEMRVSRPTTASGRWPVELAAVGQDTGGGNGEVQGQLGGQIDRWPGPGPRPCRRVVRHAADASAISAC